MLSNEQIDDLALLQDAAGKFSADVAIIGAAALPCFVALETFTRDLDIVVALDLEDFAAFSAELSARGWTRESRREHRWTGPNGSMIDLLPAGPKLRSARRIVWPESQFEMSLAGVDHVFTQSEAIAVGGTLRFKVAPPPVVALLKIIAYTEDRHRRQEELVHLKALLYRYEAASDRLFSDEVFAAELEDIEYANAFLLGSDVGDIATEEDAAIVAQFLRAEQIPGAELAELDRHDDWNERRYQMQVHAFEKGFGVCRGRTP